MKLENKNQITRFNTHARNLEIAMDILIHGDWASLKLSPREVDFDGIQSVLTQLKHCTEFCQELYDLISFDLPEDKD